MRIAEILLGATKMVGGILMTLGGLFVVDGLLPTKSIGPNPMWPEVLMGLIVLAVGTSMYLTGKALIKRRHGQATPITEAEEI